MKRFELDMKFSALVAKYLEQGYAIDTYNQAGHQKVRLYKGEDMVQVLMERESDWREEYESVVITVGIQTKSYVRGDCCHPEWNQDYEVIGSFKYYNLNDRGCKEGWYVPELEYHMIKELKQERRHRSWERHSHRILSEERDDLKKLALRVVRKQPRCASAEKKDVTCSKEVYSNGAVVYNFYKKDRCVASYHLGDMNA